MIPIYTTAGKGSVPAATGGNRTASILIRRSLLFFFLLYLYPLGTKAQYQVTDWGIQHHTLSTATSGSGSAGQVYISRIATDKHKNIYSVGIFEDTIRLGGGYSPDIVNSQMANGTGQYEFYITKMDADSNMIWVKKLDKKNFIFNHIYNAPSARGLVVDDSANIYIAGDFPGVVDFNPDPANNNLLSGPDTTLTTSKAGFVLKLDTDGNFQWVKQIVSRKVPFVGIYKMAASIDINNLVFSNTGDLVLSGTILSTGANDTVVFDAGFANTQHIITSTPGMLQQRYGFWLSIDKANGDFDTATIINTHENRGGFYEFKAVPDPYGAIYVAGSFYDSVNFGTLAAPHLMTPATAGSQRYNPFLAKYSNTGDLNWVYSFPCYQGSVRDISLDTAGLPVMAGIFMDSLRFSPALSLTAINGGMPDNHINGGYVAKFDTAGQVLWANLLQLGQNSDNQIIPNRLTHDVLNNIYIGGNIVAEFNITGITYQTNNHGFVRRYTPGGATDWTMRLGQLPHIQAQQVPVQDVYLDASNNMYIGGTLRKSFADFKSPNDTATYLITAAGNTYDMSAYLVKYVCADTFYNTLLVSTCKSYTLNAVTYTESGTYTQHYWSDGGCDSMITLNLTINDIDEPFVTVNNFELGVTSVYDSYQWLRNGALITGATAGTYTVTQNGDYQVIAGLSNGCTDTSEVYTVNNVTGIDDVNGIARDIHIYPNPAQNKLYINSPVPVSITLTSIEGRMLLHKEQAKEISLKDLSEGIYLLRISKGDGILIKTEKIVKQ